MKRLIVIASVSLAVVAAGYSDEYKTLARPWLGRAFLYDGPHHKVENLSAVAWRGLRYRLAGARTNSHTTDAHALNAIKAANPAQNAHEGVT